MRRCAECGGPIVLLAQTFCDYCRDEMEHEREPSNLTPWPVAIRGLDVVLVGAGDDWDD